MNAVASPEPRAEPGIAGTPRRGHSWSLRGRLMWLAGIATMVAWLTGGTAVLIAAYQESEQLYDERLRDVASVILSFAGHEIEEIRAEGRTGPIHQESAATLDRRYAYQIWSASGELLLMSHNAPRAPFAPLSHTGLLDNKINGKPHCVFALRSADGTMVIQVAEDESLREAFVLNVNAWLAAFLVLTTALLLLLNRWLFGNATRALDQSARQLVDRSANDLRPIQADDPPSELIPLLDSINTLFRRFEHTLDSERHFTSAAAHELRTPLAAVKIQAQVAERAPTARQAREALSALGLCVERASRMIDQLLTLARVEGMSPDGAAFTPVRLDDLARQVLQDLEHLRAAARVDVTVALEPAAVNGIEFGLAALIRNIVDNAIRHAPEGGRITVRTFARDGRPALVVDDSGHGVPEPERARVFERFYRLAGTDSEGCGVGLSIVQCVAHVHRAHVQLSQSDLGGLRVSVEFTEG